MKYISVEEAAKVIKSKDIIYIHSMACTPHTFINALIARHEELKDVEIYKTFTIGSTDYAKPEYEDSFILNTMFIQGNLRPYVNKTRTQYIPMFFSEYHLLFKNRMVELDYVILQVSPPDNNGYCTLGLSVDVTQEVIRNAKKVIAVVNPNMPKTFGDTIIHKNAIDIAVWSEEKLPVLVAPKATEIEDKIGRYVAELVEDGATLQVGIGAIPNASISYLANHKNLGIHTELLSEEMIPLIEKGVVNGSLKKIRKDKVVTTFIMGSEKFYNYVNDNPLIEILEVSYTNDPHIIRQNPKTTSINSAIEIDLTGQVCADSIGTKIYSGVGGQLDFVRGASLSEGGKAIIVVPSMTSKGVSKIVPTLKTGAGVVTPRTNVQYVVTEYGCVNLFGKTLKQRAKDLISIAHPDVREELEKEAFERFR